MTRAPLRLLTWDELKESRAFFERRLPWLFPWFLAGLGLLFTVGLLWALFGEMDLIVRGQALLRPIENVSELRTPETGQVIEKGFEPGQRVQAGTVLWRLDRRENRAEREAVLAQLTRVRQELEGWQAFRLALDGQAELTLNPEARRLIDLYGHEDRRLGWIEDQARQTWEREASLPESTRAASRLAELETAYRVAAATRSGFRLEQQQRAHERVEGARRALADLGSRLEALDRSLAAAEVRSPLDGWVEEARRFSLGDIVLAGELLARVVPESARDLRADLTVPSQDMAEVQTGQTFRLAFPKLAPADYGYLSGVLESVPEDAWLQAEGPPVYQLRGRLDRTWMQDSQGRRVDLRAGMAAEARIRVGTKPVWRFLLETLNFLH